MSSKHVRPERPGIQVGNRHLPVSIEVFLSILRIQGVSAQEFFQPGDQCFQILQVHQELVEQKVTRGCVLCSKMVHHYTTNLKF